MGVYNVAQKSVRELIVRTNRSIPTHYTLQLANPSMIASSEGEHRYEGTCIPRSI